MFASYKNTIIYKISCKDPAVTDVYVGHTIDFVKRQYAHYKSSCDVNCANKLYTTIREHGGWDNWDMQIVGFFNCKDLYEAREKEQEFFISLGATLNSVEPLPKREKKSKSEKVGEEVVVGVGGEVVGGGGGEVVGGVGVGGGEVGGGGGEVGGGGGGGEVVGGGGGEVVGDGGGGGEVPIQEQILENAVPVINNDECITTKYYCKSCEYRCDRKNDYDRHLLCNKHIETSKHKNMKPTKLHYECEKCKKEYNKYNSFWAHSQKCDVKPTPDIHMIIDNLINENRELRNLMTEHIATQQKETIKLLNQILESNITTGK